VLPEALARLDPETPYWPSSPFGGKIVNSADYGDKHNWEVWHGVGDWLHYVDDNSRFCSEFGFASSCGNRAWETVLADADKHPQSAAVRWHDKTKRGYDAYLSMVALHFPEAQSLDDLVYYTQINQAEALKCGVEHYRRLKGRCWGTLFWQLNDCWPVQSWSVIDSLLAPKAAYYWAKHFYAPVLLSLVKEDDMVVAHVTNDELHEISGELSITLETFEGEVLTTQSTHVSMSANGTGAVGHMDISAAKGLERDTVVLAHFDYARGQHATMFLAEPKKLRLPNPAISWRLDGHILHLSARRFAAYVRVELSPTLAAATDLTAFDNFFHMRAGEEVTLYLGYSANVPIGLADISVRWL
jgi:beta-mannosidase